MDIDLLLPSGEHEKEEGPPAIDNMLVTDEKLQHGDLGRTNLLVAADVAHASGAGIMNSSAMDLLEVKEYVNLEPLSGMELESHGEADSRSLFDKSRSVALESGEAQVLLDFFSQMQCSNPNFFYAVDLGEDQRLKNLLWVDAKSRHDYGSFCDVVSFDTTHMRNRHKMPLALFVGVNQHYQFMLLGCALVSDESAATYAWIMQTWLKAVGGPPPKVVITEQDKMIKSAISEVFPFARHCFCLWHIWKGGFVATVPVKCADFEISTRGDSQSVT